MKAIQKKRLGLKRRHMRLRRKLSGTEERPRLFVCKSLSHVYAQIIDDSTGRTLVSVSTRTPSIRAGLSGTGNIAAAAVVGTEIGKMALAADIGRVCFDRGGRKYHGRVKAVAEAARKAGLQF